jgi:hypothetical protein
MRSIAIVLSVILLGLYVMIVVIDNRCEIKAIPEENTTVSLEGYTISYTSYTGQLFYVTDTAGYIDVQPNATILLFCGDYNDEVGRLYVEEGKIMFKGDIDKSAKRLFEFFKDDVDNYITNQLSIRVDMSKGKVIDCHHYEGSAKEKK